MSVKKKCYKIIYCCSMLGVFIVSGSFEKAYSSDSVSESTTKISQSSTSTSESSTTMSQSTSTTGAINTSVNQSNTSIGNSDTTIVNKPSPSSIQSKDSVSPPSAMKSKIYILSIDGGGVRGLIPALVIKDMEAKLGRPITDVFDYFIGNSAGGILSLLLNVPKDEKESKTQKYTAAEVVEQIKKMSFEIFGGIQESYAEMMIASVKKAGRLVKHKAQYNPKHIETFASQLFGDVKITASIKPIFIATYDLTAEKLLILSKALADKFTAMDFKMSDIARATSAAPFYFPVKILEAPGIENTSSKLQLVDGGVGANNPLLIGLSEILRYAGNDKNVFSNVEFEIISLGTGKASKDSYEVENFEKGSPLKLLKPTINGFSKAQVQTTEETIEAMVGLLSTITGKNYRYTRLQPILDDGKIQLDATTKEAQDALEKAANKVIESEEYKELITRLKQELDK